MPSSPEPAVKAKNIPLDSSLMNEYIKLQAKLQLILDKINIVIAELERQQA